MALEDSAAAETPELKLARDGDGDVVGDTIEVNPTLAPRTIGEIRKAKALALGFKIKKMAMTPALAIHWLETRAPNRTISMDHVKRLAARMKTGWLDQPDGIKFNKDGLLIDGQHRLWAIIEADIAVEMMVYEGVDEAAMTTFDTGRSRTVAQAYQIKHSDKRSRRKVETAGVLYALNRNVACFRLDNADHAATLIERYQDAIEWVVYLSAGNKHQTSRLLPASVRGALALAYRCHQRTTKAFVDAMITGAMLQEDSPELRLRRAIEGSTNRATDLQRFELAGKVLKCIHAKLKGYTLPKRIEASVEVNAYFQEQLVKMEAA